MELVMVRVQRVCFKMVSLLALCSCAADGDTDPVGDTDIEDTDVTAPFVPEEPPALVTEGDGSEQAVYLYLYTHTEDPFNLEVSEDRYIRLGPMVQQVKDTFPAANITWTIMFQDSDADVVGHRNTDTGVATLLKDLASAGVVEFGYHAHHQPTYMERPQLDLGVESSWEDWVSGMEDWGTCLKDPLFGGCLADEGGGFQAIEKNFGPVQVVSGFYTYSDAAIEGGAARHALSKYLPERRLGFGFPDHGATTTGDFIGSLQELMTIMTPSIHTSATLLWVDDVIKINDGEPIAEVQNILVHEPAEDALGKIEALDRGRPHVLNTMIGTKYLYTKKGTGWSPTKWGYANPVATQDYPMNPRLPLEYLNDLQTMEQLYMSTEETMNYLAGDLRADDSKVSFIKSSEIVDMVATANYWEVTDAELDIVSRWLLTNWDGAPPPFASDGDLFYSLRDSFVLLTQALAGESLPASQQLGLAYGPMEQVAATAVVELGADEILSLAAGLAAELAEPASWSLSPGNMLAGSYESSVGTVNTAQLLYGMAMVYASTYAGTPVTSVTIPASGPMPETLDLLVEMGCPEGGCEGTSWSIKPARIHQGME